MKISTKGRYGLRAIVAIAKSENGLSIKNISEMEGISIRYLDKIMASLKTSEIVESTRGSKGGYKLKNDPSKISVGDILRSVEDDFSIINCPLTNNSECSNEHMCTTKYVWNRINNGLNEIIDNIYISEIIEGTRK